MQKAVRACLYSSWIRLTGYCLLLQTMKMVAAAKLKGFQSRMYEVRRCATMPSLIVQKVGDQSLLMGNSNVDPDDAIS